MFWAAQVLALLICGLSSISYLSKRKTAYLAEQFLVNVLYGVQYLLLGAFSGAVSNAISLTKYVVFYFNAKAGKKNPTWQVVLFCLLSIVLGLLAFDGWFSLIPLVTSVIFTVAIWQDNPIILRGIVIVCCSLWIVYNLSVRAYVSAAYSVVELAFAAVTMSKLLRKKIAQ